MTDKEVKESKERVSFLYQSKYIQDNITAILMDINKGGHGMYESVARAKTEAILEWLEFKKDQE